jgi:hypothetical protein
MATTASFSSGVLTEFGDTGADTIVTSRDGTGRILIDNGGCSDHGRNADRRQPDGEFGSPSGSAIQ